MSFRTRRQSQILRPSYDLTNGLVAWYQFDDTLNMSIADRSGQTLTTKTGTPKAGPGIIRNPTGKTGAVYFDGSSAYSIKPSINGQPAGSSVFSSAGWVKMDSSPPTANQSLYTYGTNATGWVGSYLYLRYVSSKFYAAHEFGSSNGLVVGATELTVGKWYHIAQVYNGSTNAIYVNGKSDATPTSASSANVGTTIFVAGGYPDFPNNNPTPNLKGWLDDLRIYNRALSAAEVYQLYASAFQSPWLDPLTYAPPATTAYPFPINIPMLGM